MSALVWTILVILLIVWIVGLGFSWSGWIWAVFAVAVILLLYNVIMGRRVT
jgi:hypothetical protein